MALAVKDFGAKGRGVVALRPFSRGELVEDACCIYFPKNEVELTNQTQLKEYTFIAGFWENRVRAVASGFLKAPFSDRGWAFAGVELWFIV